MRNPVWIGAVLLTLRFLAMFFIGMVLAKQWTLFKRHTEPQIAQYRKLMFGLTFILFLGNIIPIVFDFWYGLVDTPREVETLLLTYLLNNAIVASVSAILTWYIYKVVGKNLGED